MYVARIRYLVLLFLVAIALAATARDGEAQVLVGVRGGAYLDHGDPFVGGEVLVGLDRNLFFNPNVEFIFPDEADKITFNFDVHYDFAQYRSATFWVGAGLAVIYVDPDGPPDSRTDAGANILFGVGFPDSSRRWVPYIQGKILAADDSDFAIAFGVRF